MIPCEVVNANNTGKPCPNPGTETAELVYPSGVSETKRCCPEHAAMVKKASDAARAIFAARAEARRAESDARAERLAALRTARAIRPVAELPPADPVPPVTPVAEIPTMPDPTSTSTPPKAARGKPAPKPERSSLGGVLACRACGKSASYPLCKADRERVRKLRLLKLLPADFDAKTSPISILDEAWAALDARKARPAEPDEDRGRAEMLLDAAIVNGETSDPEAPAIVPPTVGDRWGDLSPQQKALVPVGSEMRWKDRAVERADSGRWIDHRYGGSYTDEGGDLDDDNVITRLGPATTTEPDRSGWPVLVKVCEGTYAWGSGQDAVYHATSGQWWAFADPRPCAESPDYPTAQAAADAICARLPDEAEARPRPSADRVALPPSAWRRMEALGFVPGSDNPVAWLLRRAEEHGALTKRAEAAEAEVAPLRAALEGQALANAPLRDRVVAVELERDEAVRSIAALRADAEELRALREALVSGKVGSMTCSSLDALNAAEDRMLDAVREQTRANDDRTVGVLRFATERILDSIATASKDGRPADLGLLEAVRVIATGKVPEGS